MFCKYCGKPLAEGEVCTCQSQQAENGQYIQQQPPYNAPQQPYGDPNAGQQPYGNVNAGQQGYSDPNTAQQPYGNTNAGQPNYTNPNPTEQAPSYIPPAGNPPATPAASTTNGLAIAGFIVSIVSLFLFFTVVVGVVAIILSAVAVGQVNRTNQGGKGLAIAGMVIGIISVVLAVSTIGCVMSLLPWMMY